MASHYKRVINAKPSIDTLPPKSMIKSQKARDRAKREVLNMSTSSAKPLSRTKSVDSLRNVITLYLLKPKINRNFYFFLNI
jgi:hypothetical protein